MAQQPRFWGQRAVFLGDSRVAVAALAKGRSSSYALLPLTREFAAYSFVTGIQISMAWVSTLHNPADGPSRAVSRRSIRAANAP